MQYAETLRILLYNVNRISGALITKPVEIFEGVCRTTKYEK